MRGGASVFRPESFKPESFRPESWKTMLGAVVDLLRGVLIRRHRR
jgi:hypothetical protein